MINLYIFNENFEVLGIVEKYDSLRWLNNYNGIGEFELVADATDDNVVLLVHDNIIYKTDGINACVIEFVEIKDNIMTVRGRSTKKFLTDRIVFNQITIYNVENGLHKAVTDNCINSARPIKNLVLGTKKGYTDATETQVTYKPINEVIELFPQFGYEVKYDFINKKHEVDIYKGSDVSNVAVFSEEFDNIVESLISMDKTEYKNFAIVAGQGEGADRSIITIGATGGEEIRELFVDARDIEKVRLNDDGTETPLTTTEYETLLKARGSEKLAECIIKNSFVTTLKMDGNLILNEDYKLGDIVTCKSKRFNLQLKVRITKLQEIYDATGKQILATLGEY